tara:strand:- start:228 stop:1205 length:978 start_codon:yes stop_codon:yes gene_type:complete
MGKTLLFLGGSGFIGKSLITSFINNKIGNNPINKIILIANRVKQIKDIIKKSKKEIKFEIISKNLLNIKDLPYADYVVHAAEYIDPKKIQKKFENKEDIKTLHNIFKILKKKKFINSKILYVSSGAVYKSRKTKKKFKETSKIFKLNKSPKSISEIYIRNKLLGEQLTRKLSVNFKRKTSIARCFAFIGEHFPLKSQYVLGNFVDSILGKKPLKIYDKSSRRVFRSFLYSDELINLLLKILFKSNKSSSIFNVGSDNEISIWDLASIVKKKYKLKLIYPYQTNKEYDYYVPNINKLKNIFKFKQKFNIEKSISLTVQNIQKKKRF